MEMRIMKKARKRPVPGRQWVSAAACIALLCAAGARGAGIDVAKFKALKKSSTRSGEYDQFVDRVYRRLAEEFGEGELPGVMEGEALPRAFTEIDQSIDPNTYVLGANDELTIYVWGSVSEIRTATVDHEGNLIIPAVGTIPVSRMTLAEAKELVRRKVLEVYKDVELSVVLSQIRRFRAYVLGSVEKPGAYTVNGATRVSDLIDLAGGFRGKADSTRLRGIEVANDSQATRYADLAIFYHNNDVSKNFYLTEGDRVFVRERKDIVSISGEVVHPGTYDFVTGDRLTTIIAAAGGLSKYADSGRVLLSCFAGDGSIAQTTVSLADNDDPALNPDDRILVSRATEYRVHRNVWVAGEVLYPGMYPIEKGRTRVQDVIEMAGGFTEDASPRQSTMYRQDEKGGREGEVDVLENLPLSSLNPVEKAYVKSKFAVKSGIVSIDFGDLYEGEGAYNLVLRDGDSISIARRSLTVEVAGAVVTPGHVPFKEGASCRYYVSRAGGYSSRARRSHTVIVRQTSGVWLRPRDVDAIREGDIILVPEKEYRAWFVVARDVFVILSSIAAVITTYIAISNAVK
ncbi:MAG: hypothetical protein GF418_09945 [Chitinivibrionales bacterium]|nr:hypothetical protein [Chitinivibrionales bacterium]